MDSGRAARVKEILLAVADLSEAERAAFLNEACKDDPDLRREIDSILVHEKEPTAPARAAGASSSRSNSHPTTIGPYKVLERIGEGGMGIVYLAEQTEPVRRRVALKVIKLGMDTKQVVARFEAERQALAMMDHPNIAKVLDAGATPEGRPYFVMECVQGIPITDYCDRHNLKMSERLELFTHICEAVQHAHQKGVIHRDLKPSNVLVEVVDDHPVPKVIDFGVAKATAHRLTERTVYTEQGQLIGTPEYMSPEQAEMTGLNVDTRTDIYSLGVLLYELLVGALPFERGTLRRASYAEIRRILREVDPPKPSTRLSSLGAGTDTVAKHRRTDRSSLLGQLRGDLDWITMKALEKDRTRRYASASEFAADIRRFLNDEPILARPPSPAYRMRKYMKRHRVGVGFTATICLAVVLGFVLLSVQNARIAAAMDEAELVTVTLEEMLTSVDPTKSGRDVTVRETLDATAKTLGEKYKDQPLVEARLRYTLGKTYSALGESEKAEEQLRRALDIRRENRGEEDLATIQVRNELFLVLEIEGRYDEAERLAQKNVEVARRALGEEHPETLVALLGLGWAYLKQGRLDEAEDVCLQALEAQERILGKEDRETLDTMLGLAAVYSRQGRYDEAETLQNETIRIQRRVLGDEHPQTLANMGNLAVTYSRQGRYDEAEKLRSEVLEIQRRILGEEHPNTLNSLSNLAWMYSRQGRHEEAEALRAEKLEICRRALGDDNPRTLDAMGGLAWMYSDQRRHEEAEALFAEELEICRRTLGDDNPRTLEAMGDLGWTYSRHGRHEEAEALFAEELEICRRTLGDDNPITLEAMSDLGWTYSNQGRQEEAEALLVEALEISRRVGAETDARTLYSMHYLSVVYTRQGRYDESAAIDRKCADLARREFGDSDPEANLQRYNAACNAALRGDRDEAIRMLREALDHGYRGYSYWPSMDDPELGSLHGDPEFEEIAEEFRRRNEEGEPATAE